MSTESQMLPDRELAPLERSAQAVFRLIGALLRTHSDLLVRPKRSGEGIAKGERLFEAGPYSYLLAASVFFSASVDTIWLQAGLSIDTFLRTTRSAAEVSGDFSFERMLLFSAPVFAIGVLAARVLELIVLGRGGGLTSGDRPQHSSAGMIYLIGFTFAQWTFVANLAESGLVGGYNGAIVVLALGIVSLSVVSSRVLRGLAVGRTRRVRFARFARSSVVLACVALPLVLGDRLAAQEYGRTESSGEDALTNVRATLLSISHDSVASGSGEHADSATIAVRVTVLLTNGAEQPVWIYPSSSAVSVHWRPQPYVEGWTYSAPLLKELRSPELSDTFSVPVEVVGTGAEVAEPMPKLVVVGPGEVAPIQFKFACTPQLERAFEFLRRMFETDSLPWAGFDVRVHFRLGGDRPPSGMWKAPDRPLDGPIYWLHYRGRTALEGHAVAGWIPHASFVACPDRAAQRAAKSGAGSAVGRAPWRQVARQASP